MAVVAGERAEPHDPARGWVDRLLAATFTRLGGVVPGSLAVAAVVLLVPSGLLWLAASMPFPELDSRVWLPAAIALLVLLLIGLLDRIALRALTQFEPALPPGADLPAIRHALTTTPDRPALALIVVVGLLATAGYLSDAPTLASLRARPVGEAAMIVAVNWISIAAVSVLLLHAWVQLRAVVRLHRDAVGLDLFDAAPLHAFARLTAGWGIGFLLLGVLVLGDPTARRDSLFYAAEALAVTLAAAVTFAVPLWGMHERLEAEQQRLLRHVTASLRETMARVEARAAGEELAGIDLLGAAQSALIAQRDLVARLSTWPWSSGTVRGFASALLLPLALWVATRLLERVV